jgi:hypothetical protein
MGQENLIALAFSTSLCLSWKCRRFKCRLQLVLTTWCRVFPTRRPDTADVSVTSCDVGFFFSVSYVVLLPNCQHVVVVCSLITINHSRTGTNLHTQERNERFSTLQLLASSVWRHLSRLLFLSPSCWRLKCIFPPLKTKAKPNCHPKFDMR